MARLLKAALLALALAAPAAPAAEPQHEIAVHADVRIVASEGRTSYLDGGLGKLRYDADHDGLALGELGLSVRKDLLETLQLGIDAVTYADGDKNPIDLNEAWLQWRPWPKSAWRPKVKLGAFYPPISLENVMTGWRSPYTVSWSAINSWIGEELRTIGLEYDLDWRGTQAGSNFELGMQAAVYAWNDPAGVIIAARGWALHDRQTALFGRVGEPGYQYQYPLTGRTLFAEIDHEPGYYVGLSGRYTDLVELRVLHYDNRGDRVSYDAGIDDLAWDTVFDSVGVALTPTRHLTVLAQWLKGETYINPFIDFEWEFESKYLLASYERGAHRFSARYDTFEMEQSEGMPPLNADKGHAWTLAWLWQLGEHWSAALESLWVSSSTAARADVLGERAQASERTLQLALRWDL